MRGIRIAVAAAAAVLACAAGFADDQPGTSVVRDGLVGHPWEVPFGEKNAPPSLPKVRYSHVVGTTAPGAEQKRHVVQAIEHLEAAGLNDEASRLRHELQRLELAELERQRQRKAAELTDIEARIQHLRSQSWADRGVTIQLQLGEIPHEWLEAMLADLRPAGNAPAGKTAVASNRATTIVIDDHDTVERLIHVLTQQEVVKVLARPTVRTTNGTAATVLSGGEMPRVVPAAVPHPQMAMDWFGLKMTALPTMLDEHRLRLQFTCEVRERINEAGAVKAAKVQSTVELKDGQTILLSLPYHTTERDLLTVVRVELTDAATGAPVAGKARSDSPYTAIPLTPRRLEPVPEPIPETAELPAPESVVK
jgi:hypothetical protein